jgi:adenine-specific DNA-methyltransferase
MILQYEGKKPKEVIYQNIPLKELKKVNDIESPNLLIKADNLIALKWLIEKKKMAGKVDLIYIDPPFSTNNLFTIDEDRANTISSSKNGTIAYIDKLKGADYLEFMRETLILLREILSDRGSIYVHIDYKIGHYIKIIMDEIFGIKNFRNDITRIKCNPKNFARKGYGNIKDLILFYTKTDNFIWHEPYIPYTEEDLKKLFPKVDEYGRRYTTVPIHAPGETKNGETSKPFKGILPPKGRHWRTDVKTLEEWDNKGLIEWSANGVPRKKIYAEERKGKRLQDIWEFKDPQYPVYPTEKNYDLLDFIVKTSSEEDSYVLDCFCGSGTTLAAAHLNKRKWIGIDNSEQAIEITKKKLTSIQGDFFISNCTFELYENSCKEK